MSFVLIDPEMLKIKQKLKPFKQTKYWIGLLVLSVLSIAAVTLTRQSNLAKSDDNTSQPVPTPQPQVQKVAALGKIEPQGEIMSISAPTSLEAVQVEQLLVQVGDRVKQGQTIAILDGVERQQAALNEAKMSHAVAEPRLAKVRAGAKSGTIAARQAAIANVEAELTGEIQTQTATISKLKAELNNARTEFQRNQQLFDDGAISASEVDSKRLTLETAKEQLNEATAALSRTKKTLNAGIAEARASLEETAEVRPVDIQVAQAEVNQAQATVARAEADMELAYVRAPVDGEILDIHTRPGEALNEKGIAQMGQTEQMMVVAEIDQNDINQVKLGQPVTVTSGVFAEQLQGKVHQVGSLIAKNDILDTDPAASEDSRVVEAKIMLDPQASQKVSKLSNLEVDVIIETGQKP